ncbi:acyltransferase [Qipengyuania gaetbuli]|uniref:acyltransferase family protein n=1 Tax=Qipengyuania gaetbuli TaxID=266952 RepID=UPI001C99D772|nr:acyltransferase [Qipengyuania gaetbuli]MBY6016086.1 acyltransferase [Qipengyuania gaetbuli]
MTIEAFQIRNEVKSLTSLRFIAALYVFLFHLQIRTPVFGAGWIGNAVAEGAVGMTIFFTLSGFILSHAYGSAPIDQKKYIWNRIARLYPVYILAACLALPWLAKEIIYEIANVSPLQAILSCIILLVTAILLVQAWIPQTFSFWNNSASWSISVEAFFYSLFPYFSGVLRSTSATFLISLLLGLSVLSSLAPLSDLTFSNSPSNFALFYAMPIFRLPEFLAGIIAYRLMNLLNWSGRVRIILIGCVTLGVAHVVLLAKFLPIYTLHNWIVIPAVSSMLILLFKQSEAGAPLLESGPFVWLGKISYCFYSFQFHVLEGLYWLMPPEEFGGLVYAILATALLLVVSAATHHFFEEPVRVWLRKRGSWRASGGLASV